MADGIGIARITETLRLYARISRLYATGRWARTPDYDSIADGYDATWPQAMIAHNRDLVARLPDSIRSAIDLGCGTGALTSLIADRFPEATVEGVDLSPRMLALAKTNGRHNGRVRWTRADMIGCLRDREADSVDAVACAWSGAYVKMRDLAYHAGRVLRPGGVFALLVNVRKSMPEVENAVIAVMRRRPDRLMSDFRLRLAACAEAIGRHVRRAGLQPIVVEERECPVCLPAGHAAAEWLRHAGIIAGFAEAIGLHDDEEQRRLLGEALGGNHPFRTTHRFAMLVALKS